jgi:choice-of-anchor B domain-containing protein
MKSIIICFFIAIFFLASSLSSRSGQGFAQNNVTFLSNLNQYPSAGYSDIWGYTDPNGNEYALLGVRTGTSIISLADPTNPFECAFIPAPQSSWREIKVHNHYAYVATDATGNGLQIIDLSQLPNTATLVNTLNTYFNNAHDLLIDNGFCYVVGGDGIGGMSILDLSDPVNPVRTAYYTASGYIHDIYVWNDTVVASTGYTEEYHLIDVTNKYSPQFISASAPISGIYAHSGWMTENKRYFYGTDEFNVRDLTVWDLQNRNSWNLVVPQWQLSNNSRIHNLYILGNYAHVSYYTSGYVVLDITDPTNPQFDGQYDTYPQNNSSNYDGAWGCYPYLPSGNTLISDMSTGLWVLHFDGVVPVELTSFTAQASGNSVTLNWKTATETNNLGFEIQRNLTGEFVTVGFIEGVGTTTEPHQYSYIDQNLDNGGYEYRLKQIDYDGSAQYSDVVEVEVFSVTTLELKQNYPNPFNPSTNIKFNIPSSGYVNLSVFNLVGEKVKEIVNEILSEGEYNLKFDASNLPSGIYIAKLSSDNFNQSIKMTLLK